MIPKELYGICAIHKDAEGTYYLLKDFSYYVYDCDECAGNEELYGPFLYSDLKDLKYTPSNYMGL